MKDKIIKIFSNLCNQSIDNLEDRIDDHFYIEANGIRLSNDTYFVIENISNIEKKFDIKISFVRDGQEFIIKLYGNMYGQECPCCGNTLNELGDCPTNCDNK